ncbi:carboxypeptidase regulatory-like domain-containing protein [Hymenobacter sp. HDW8]|uniref:carboxypeptidase regulatory-like domain-containing protein n=1 Tax=Hymenobacter sp. HDW8 TaxID=2714932 RepID=UPI001F0E2CAE|nr:carboxypeptidase regulatory-like domain-containing protein [Hymenobacter sp. HDW8]
MHLLTRLRNKLFSLLLTLLLVLVGTGVMAQQTANRILVSGTVRDADGQPLELVDIGVEGQPDGTTTDTGGQFSLRVTPPGPGAPALVLVARRLGYKVLRTPLDLTKNAPSGSRSLPMPALWAT